jgi:TolB-like protein/DNA-binding SARP family transcriptional activator
MDTSSTSGTGVEGSARWSLRLFGDFQLSERRSGEKVVLPGKRERVLLAYLALSPNGRQPRRKLVTLLWGEAADETTLENLRTSVFNLRKALGDTERQIIASEDRDIVLDASAFEVDVLSFRRLAAGPGVAELEETAKLYAGDFLEGFSIESEEFESWRREEATRSKGQALDALTRLMTQLAASGDGERAIETGLRTLRLEPLHEAAVRRLMRLYAESGRRAAAAELYRTLSEALKKELGAQPEAETRSVFAEIASGGEERPQSLAIAVPAAPSLIPSMASAHGPLVEGMRPSTPQLATSTAVPQVASLKVKTRSLAWILAGLAAVMAIFLLYQFVPASTRTAQQEPAEPAGAISIAVLPFSNLSSDPEQEFFSDGVTEEITLALAKVPGLVVIGRTSAGQFKGQNKDLRMIGQALGTTHLIEGSVRKEGDRVRITAQLIQSNNGLNLWSDSYDRQLTGLFAVQEDIAQAIAGALRVPLGLKSGNTLITSRIADPEIYQQYLQLRSPSFPATLDTVEAFVARAPGFAPGWARLAGAYRADAAVASRSGDLKTASFLTDKEDAAARKAIQLDASYAGGYSELAGVQTRRGKWSDADDLYKRALALDPNDPTLLNIYSQTLFAAGRLKEALRVRERLRALDPLVPGFNQITASIMVANGQIDAGIALLEPDMSTGARRNVYLAEAYAMKRRFADAADTLLRVTTQIDRRSVEEAARLLRSAPGKTDQPGKLPALVAELGFIYAYTGAPERMLEYPEQGAKEENFTTIQTVWRLSAAPLRKTERFKALMRNAGLVDYWRARGWPDLCRPMGADDFVCD